jgi:hypothetical protein
MPIIPVDGRDYLSKQPPPTLHPQQHVDVQPQTTHHLTCKVCDRGVLVEKKIFRLSTPVVLIGFILLIPSLIGMLIGAMGLIGSLAATGASATGDAVSFSTQRDAIENMIRLRVPRRIVAAVVALRSDEIDDWFNSDHGGSGPPPLVQQEAVKKAQSDLASGISQFSVAAWAGPFSVFIGVASFVGALFGWLLVMRRRVLQCADCGTVVNTS